MKNTGTLRIQTFAARQSAPMEGVTVAVQGDGFTLHCITDATGSAALVFCSRELLCVVRCSSPGRYQLHFHRGTGLLGTGGQQQPDGGQEPQKLAACDLVHLIPA